MAKNAVKVLIAPDSFKEALPATEVVEAICRGLQMASPKLVCIPCPLADGGEHTLDVWLYHVQGRRHHIKVGDALGRPRAVAIGLSADGRTALVELAQAAGLEHIAVAQRNPLYMSTFGVGQMIRAAARQGASSLVLTLGGSATHDCGAGMAAALGWRFLDETGTAFVPTGATLDRVVRIEPPESPCQFQEVIAWCDVQNPLLGPQGAAHTYAAQKGATPEEVALLERKTHHFAQLLEHTMGCAVASIPGSGAAGGMGAGAMVFLGARLVPGAAWLLDEIGFDQYLTQAHWLITGEGQFDAQTAHGKLIATVAARAQHREVGVVVLCGSLEATPEQIRAMGVTAAMSIVPGPVDLSQSLTHTSEWLTYAAWAVGRIIIHTDSSTGNSSK